MNVAVVAADQAGGMARSVTRGFEQAGTKATLVAYPRLAPNLHRFRLRGTGLLNRGARSALRPFDSRLLTTTLAHLAVDLVIFLKCDDLDRATYRRIRGRTGARLAAFHPDDPFNRGGLLRPGPSHRRSLVQLREVDVYFTWSYELRARAARLGARRSVYLPFACDPELHPRPARGGAVPKELAADVCFVGNWDEKREWWLAAVAELGFDLAIWGHGYWRSRCRSASVRAAWRGRALFGAELAQAVTASRINLNILRRQNEGACNMRTFEIPCAGGFMLHERSPELPALFAPGEECADFATVDELTDKIRYYLRHRRERLRLAEAGHRRGLEQTYKAWAARVLEAISTAENEA